MVLPHLNRHHLSTKDCSQAGLKSYFLAWHFCWESFKRSECHFTLLSRGDGGDPAGGPVGAGVGGNAGASIIVTVRGHGKGQGLEVGTDLLGQVQAQVGGVAVGLALGVGERPRAEVRPHFGVLQKDPGKISDPALSPHPDHTSPPPGSPAGTLGKLQAAKGTLGTLLLSSSKLQHHLKVTAGREC